MPVAGPSGGGAKPDPVPVPESGVHGDSGSDDGIIGTARPSKPARKRGTATESTSRRPGLTPGTEVTWQDYTTPSGVKYPNYGITCTQCPEGCPGRNHGDLDKFKRACGDIEPLAWLHVWERMPVPRGTKHNKLTPKSADVAAYAEANRAQLTVLRRELLCVG